MTDWLAIRDMAPDDFSVVTAVETAFSAAGVPLNPADFAFDTPLSEAFSITVGRKLNIQDTASRLRVDRIIRLASELSDCLSSIVSEASSFGEYHRDGREYPHIALAKFLDVEDDITGERPHSVSSTTSSLKNLLDVASQAARVGSIISGRGPKPNLAYDRFRTLIQEVYTSKTGRVGIKVDGEAMGPLVGIMASVEPHLPNGIRPSGKSTGARLNRRRIAISSKGGK